MAGFTLVPVEDSGSPVHLPEGETVLGRGPFLGVTDKRVSRHHGLLKNQDGQLRIKPTHTNPCFCQSSPDDPPQPLDRDKWHILKQGDIFSLLPGKYMYKVVVVGGENGTLRDIKGFQGDPNKSPASPEPSNEPVYPATQQSKTSMPHSPEKVPETQATVAKEDEALVQDPAPTQTKSVIGEEEKKCRDSPEPKKRVLPSWMMADIAPLKASSTPKGPGNQGRGASTSSSSRVPTLSKRARATAPSSGEESEHSELEQTPRKRARRKKSDEDEAVQSKTNVSSPATKARWQMKTNKIVGSDESDNFDMEVDDAAEMKRAGAAAMTKASSSESTPKLSEPENGQGTNPLGSDGASGSDRAKTPTRTPCPFGKDCYRKNPLHFQECCHPGDSDYEEDSKEEKDDNANLPECPYGSDCYRKNPLHRKEYKHTTTRAKRTVQKNYNDDEEDDDSGDDDSFINDASEDMDEDSDYVPPDSDDSGKEDLKRLKKEAMAFVNKKK